MNTYLRTFIILVVDALCLVIACVMAYAFRFDFDLLLFSHVLHAVLMMSIAMVVYSAMFFVFSMNRVVWRFVSLNEMIRLSQYVVSAMIICMMIQYFFLGFHYVPLSVLPLQALLYLVLLVVVRCFYRLYRGTATANVALTKVLVMGAGCAGESIIRDMLRQPERGYKPVGLLDDDVRLHKRSIHGVKVLGGSAQLEMCQEVLKPDMVVMAIPGVHGSALLNRVYESCRDRQIPVHILCGLSQLSGGTLSTDSLRQVSIEDLLGRDTVKLLDNNLVSRFHGKVVLVTGGGGSIGSELCRQIATNSPRSLVIVDNNEYNLYEIDRELRGLFPNLTMESLLLDMANKHEVDSLFQHIRPHIIFHAAAFKHVPMLEYQAFSAVKNNVLATRQLADLSNEHGVENFILVSTDKAVNPTNIMGMSKRLAEIYCQNYNKRASTDYTTVRFGNVLGSAGSVLPLFREQLAKGGPLTVTHPDMTRYFMMIPEAVSLILQAFLIGQGGEIFVLDMGSPVKIVDLAEKLISLSGKTPYKHVDIEFIDPRPGEKLFEELFYDSEHMQETSLEKIFESHSRDYPWQLVTETFSSIQRSYLDHDLEALLRAMSSLVPEYLGQHQPSLKANAASLEISQ